MAKCRVHLWGRLSFKRAHALFNSLHQFIYITGKSPAEIIEDKILSPLEYKSPFPLGRGWGWGFIFTAARYTANILNSLKLKRCLRLHIPL